MIIVFSRPSVKPPFVFGCSSRKNFSQVLRAKKKIKHRNFENKMRKF